MQTLQHIPVWIFILLIGLIVMGLLQTRTRTLHKRRLLSVNIALTVFTLVGVVQQWRHTPWLAVGLLSWAASCALVAWALGQGETPADSHFNANTQRFTVPGSWLPLALFMAIFACKFGVGMLTATAPEHIQSLSAAIGISAAYGLFSGVLNGRALRLLKLPTRQDRRMPLSQ